MVDEPTDEVVPEDSPGTCSRHSLHLFGGPVDSDCVLTEQLLQLRVTLEAAFPGCDLYAEKKPKGGTSNYILLVE
jgi:hypothetical protein